MEKLDKITDVKVGEQQTEIDPRSRTAADKSFNLIGTGLYNFWEATNGFGSITIEN